MKVINPELVADKKVILRMDLDVPLWQAQGRLEVEEDFRLQAGLPTLKMCLEHAARVIILGHIGRPEGKEVPELSVEPIYDWLMAQGLNSHMECGKLKLLENLRFEDGEEKCDLTYAKELALLGEVYINEAFASYRKAASTTVLPTLLPNFAGLRFAQEVETLTRVREDPKRPLVAIMGGAKVEDKLPVIKEMVRLADIVLVGGKLVAELEKEPGVIKELGPKVALARLNPEGTDITPETVQVWSQILLHHAQMVVWNGPVGKIEGLGLRVQGLEEGELGSGRGTYELAQAIISSRAETIVGGGDTVGFLGQVGMLDKFSFVSTGGGAMLKFLTEGTLPTIEALED